MNDLDNGANPETTTKIETFKPLKVTKSYKSELADKWEEAAKAAGDKYAVLEVENRHFDPVTGKKRSAPSLVTFNRHDLLQFKGKETVKTIGGKKVKTQSIVCQKDAMGLSVNAVIHIPKSFGIEISLDPWEK